MTVRVRVKMTVAESERIQAASFAAANEKGFRDSLGAILGKPMEALERLEAIGVADIEVAIVGGPVDDEERVEVVE